MKAIITTAFPSIIAKAKKLIKNARAIQVFGEKWIVLLTDITSNDEKDQYNKLIQQDNSSSVFSKRITKICNLLLKTTSFKIKC